MNLPATRSQNFGLVPTNMTEAMKLAEMMAAAALVPQALQKKPADCLMVIQQAVRWQMDPFAVAQECSVISGKLMHSGKLVAAVINARGNLAERLSFTYEGQGDARTITVSGRLEGEEAPRTVSVKFKDARTQNSMWTKQPDQQLMYHGSRVWARRHTPELMLGVYSPEEFDRSAEDIIEDWGERRGAGLIKAAALTKPIEEEPPVELWTEDGDTPPEWSSKWDELGPVKQAGILCSDVGFWKFLAVTSEEEAVRLVRAGCAVKSRSELATNNEAARLWRDIVAKYRAWQREPEIIDQVSPPQPPANAADPESALSPPGSAAPIPTAAEYHAQWQTMIEAATNAMQIRSHWNAQAEERQQIKWTTEHPFKPLQEKIAAAIKFLERRD